MLRTRERWMAAALVALASAIEASGQDSPALLQRAGWLAGCWEVRTASRVTTETWMPPLGDLMLGSSRTVSGTVATAFEHIRIRAEGGGARLVYTAIPSGQREASFPSTSISDTAIVFENPAHDFPQRIIYRRRGRDSLLARVEGPGANGTTRGINYPMARVRCTEPPAPRPPADSLFMDYDRSSGGPWS